MQTPGATRRLGEEARDPASQNDQIHLGRGRWFGILGFLELEGEFAGAAVAAVGGIEAALEEFKVDVSHVVGFADGELVFGMQDLRIWNCQVSASSLFRRTMSHSLRTRVATRASRSAPRKVRW